MKTHGPVLFVEALRLAAHRRLPLSASAMKKARMAEKRIQQWRGKRRERVGEGKGRGGGGASGGGGRSGGG